MTLPATIPCPEYTLGQSMMALSRSEGKIDEHGRVIPIDGVIYENNVMRGVQYLADEGGAQWVYKTPHATALSKHLGYHSIANCSAMWGAALFEGLITAEGWVDPGPVDGGLDLDGGSMGKTHNPVKNGFLMVTDKGYVALEKWEYLRDDL